MTKQGAGGEVLLGRKGNDYHWSLTTVTLYDIFTVDTDSSIESIESTCRSLDLVFRVYKTKNGYRVFLTSRRLHYDNVMSVRTLSKSILGREETRLSTEGYKLERKGCLRPYCIIGDRKLEEPSILKVLRDLQSTLILLPL